MMKPNRRRRERPPASPGSGPKPPTAPGSRPVKPPVRRDRAAEAPTSREHPQYGTRIPPEELEFMRQQAEERARERKNRPPGTRPGAPRPGAPRSYGPRPPGAGRYAPRDVGPRTPRYTGAPRPAGPPRHTGGPYRPAGPGRPRQTEGRPPSARGARPSGGYARDDRERQGGAPFARPERRPLKPFRTGVQSAGEGPPRPSPARLEPPLQRLITALNGYQESAALLAAHELGFFPEILRQPQIAADVARRLGTDPRGTEILLDAVVALGGLHRHGATYVLPREFAPYLVPGHDGDATGMVEWAHELYGMWGDLARAVREGSPRLRLTGDALLEGDPARVRRYIRAVHTVSREAAPRVAELAPLLPGAALLDVGGGSGIFAAEYARRTPELKATLLDLPPTIEVAREILRVEGVEDLVTFYPGDYRTDPFPGPVDAVLLSNVLQTESEETAGIVLRKAWEALRPGGTLLIHGIMPDSQATPSPAAALFAVRMFLVFDMGNAWNADKVGEWLARERFAVRATRSLGSPFQSKLIIASRLE